MAFDENVYTQIRHGCQESAAEVVPILYSLTRPASVVDVGGGEGWWAAEFTQYGTVGLCFDETALHAGVKAPGIAFAEVDLAHCPDPVPEPEFDMALCLEVGEHLPEASADRLVAWLASLAPIVIFSAAIPHQGGHGHVNEQWPVYWSEKFRGHGLRCSDDLRPVIWNNDKVEPWYRQNLLIFATEAVVRKANLSTVSVPDSVVHPVIYGWRCSE